MEITSKRPVFNVKYYCDNGMSLMEISEKTGMPESTIRRRWQRGARTYEELTENYAPHHKEVIVEWMPATGRRFVEALNKRNMTFRQVCKGTGVSRTSIYNFCYYDADISSKRFAKICEFVGVSTDYVLGIRKGRLDDYCR